MSCDPNMAVLQTLTDCFLLENEVHLDLRDVTEEDMELWFKKSMDLIVSAPLRSPRWKLTWGSVGSVGGCYGGMTGRGVLDELWRPSKKLTKARWELQEAQEWLKGCNLKPVPSTPVPTGNTTARRALETPGNPRGTQTVSPMKTGKGVLPEKGTPHSQETLSQLGSRASLKKPVGGGEEEPNKSGEGSEEGGSSQGEDEVDEMDNGVDSRVVTTGATARQCGMQVAELDQQEFPLMGGKWAGKGAVRKAAEIRVNVSGPPADQTD